MQSKPDDHSEYAHALAKEPNLNLEVPTRFVSSAAELGIEFEAGDVERLARYVDMLLRANEQFNLTAVTERDEVWMRHILDSLTLVPLIASAGALAIVDVGSGGGLPGIPLAIVLHDARITLVEATGKKANFLRETIANLGLTNASVINDRAETLGRDLQHHRERFDMAIARAVGRLPILLELTLPLVKVGGLVLAMKGAQADQEIAESKQALHLLHAHVIEVRRAQGGVIVIVEKQRKTPRSYPRLPGEPKKSPLGQRRSTTENAP